MVSDRRSQGTPEWVHGAGHQSWEVAQMGRPETGLSSSFKYSLGVQKGVWQSITATAPWPCQRVDRYYLQGPKDPGRRHTF